MASRQRPSYWAPVSMRFLTSSCSFWAVSSWVSRLFCYFRASFALSEASRAAARWESFAASRSRSLAAAVDCSWSSAASLSMASVLGAAFSRASALEMAPESFSPASFADRRSLSSSSAALSRVSVSESVLPFWSSRVISAASSFSSSAADRSRLSVSSAPSWRRRVSRRFSASRAWASRDFSRYRNRSRSRSQTSAENRVRSISPFSRLPARRSFRKSPWGRTITCRNWR